VLVVIEVDVEHAARRQRQHHHGDEQADVLDEQPVADLRFACARRNGIIPRAAGAKHFARCGMQPAGDRFVHRIQRSKASPVCPPCARDHLLIRSPRRQARAGAAVRSRRVFWRSQD
jgi:hypothetical protein